ncbi:MAG: MarR family winged helix-turn-helix transcriptional regulator [Planctomycetaceae bacterium]|nr:MarR family winged helix-turn-helix transcriptional regulator [Planctomycetaceae bacterium]
MVVLRRISQAIELWSRELQRRFGLTSPQLAVLRQVAEGVNLSPTSIGEALHLSQPTVTGVLQRLEDAGLISRVKSTVDRRSVIAAVTDEGRALLAKAPPLLRDQFREQMADLPDYRQSEILSSLQLVAHMLQAPEVDPVPFLTDPKSDDPAKPGSRPATGGTNGSHRT